MRESLTLFAAVALCLLLCLPAKSLNKIWNTSTNSLTTVVHTVASIPSILSITFKSGNYRDSSKEPVEMRLISQVQPHQYALDWSTVLKSPSFIKIYNAAGNLLSDIDVQNVDRQSDNSWSNINLTPGIYYASVALNIEQNTQKVYAKFVVK